MIAEKMESTENHTINSALILPKWQFVGMTGFEPATTRPPAVCATGLRHIPKIKSHKKLWLSMSDKDIIVP